MQPGYQHGPRIATNMTMSVVAIILCPPLAVPALINAARVEPLQDRGDYAGAHQAAAESRRWSRRALLVGVLLWGLSLVCCGAGWVVATS
jgi:hypothetical protein